jgi:hypothetical protein
VTVSGPWPALPFSRPGRQLLSSARCGACTAHCQRPTWPVPSDPGLSWRSDGDRTCVRADRWNKTPDGQGHRNPSLTLSSPHSPLSLSLAAAGRPTPPAGAPPATATVTAVAWLASPAPPLPFPFSFLCKRRKPEYPRLTSASSQRRRRRPAHPRRRRCFHALCAGVAVRRRRGHRSGGRRPRRLPLPPRGKLSLGSGEGAEPSTARVLRPVPRLADAHWVKRNGAAQGGALCRRPRGKNR